ncbi:hypothetical protein F6R98_01850 [Candidatus Methylospira mobilis]|uniref:Uncharacterized protein n=1 Tax=Candidatus Methylospira mobilis TaxID=1808979 RepID=A0A5Q0BCJ6_9GAMM|nr:hypothetical protein [Candidatus Methylospira mobilis]QFY41520.1 hypothetical protein F6R98_01850 [Candidatus Methylospira mobilis]WNV05244.1 hypothetical protein RP726_02255 [Candidatus Methylospira mobilis]
MQPSHTSTSVRSATASGQTECKICTIRLERLCYRRAWWFCAFREALAGGIRLFALAYRVYWESLRPRSHQCFRCLRFRKNALQCHSPLFRTLDSYLNPFFNRVRDSLLTPEELEQARSFALRAASPDFDE